METVRSLRGYPSSRGFPAYLRGMETPNLEFWAANEIKFPAYLRGMETVRLTHEPTVAGPVPSLPKRNGNASEIIDANAQDGFPAYLRGMETRFRRRCGCNSFVFPAYLRGMETIGGLE